MSQPAKKSAIERRDDALKRRRRWATVSVIFTLALVCFSYYFYQVFFTANIETKGKPTYVIIHRGDDWQAALETIDETGAVVDKLSLHFVAKLMKYPGAREARPLRAEGRLHQPPAHQRAQGRLAVAAQAHLHQRAPAPASWPTSSRTRLTPAPPASTRC